MSWLTKAIEDQYSLLETRLSVRDQKFIALPERPTIADLATLPFANAKVADMAAIDFDRWPNLSIWSEEMYSMPFVQSAMERVSNFGS